MAVTAGCKGFEDIVDSSSVGSWNCGGNSNEGPWGCAAAGTSKSRGKISSWGSIDRSKHSRRGCLGCLNLKRKNSVPNDSTVEKRKIDVNYNF